MKQKIEFESIPWENPIKGLRVKAVIENNKKIRLAEFSKEFIEPDWCIKGHIGYIIEGKLEIDFNGTIVKYKKGDSIVIPDGERYKHKAKIISDKALVFLVEEEN